MEFDKIKYTRNFFKLNPIRKSELNYYQGKVLNKSPHGIDNDTWNKSFNWAKKTKNLTIEEN